MKPLRVRRSLMEVWDHLPLEAWYLYVLLGVVCGIFGAMFGVGSGIIMVPALVLLFGLLQKSAQGTCLAVMVPMALVGALRYKWNPDIHMDLSIIALLSAGAVVGALIGSSIAGALSGSLLRKMFAVVMIAVAVKMLFTASPSKPPKPEEPAQQTTGIRTVAPSADAPDT